MIVLLGGCIEFYNPSSHNNIIIFCSDFFEFKYVSTSKDIYI